VLVQVDLAFEASDDGLGEVGSVKALVATQAAGG
jgi:hypothetical protein